MVAITKSAEKILRFHKVCAEVARLKETRDSFAAAAMRSLVPLCDNGRWTDERIAHVANLAIRFANAMIEARAKLDDNIDFYQLAEASVDDANERYPDAQTTKKAASTKNAGRVHDDGGSVLDVHSNQPATDVLQVGSTQTHPSDVQETEPE